MQGRDLKVEMVGELVWLPLLDSFAFWVAYDGGRCCVMTLVSGSTISRCYWYSSLVDVLNGVLVPDVPTGWAYAGRGIITLNRKPALEIRSTLGDDIIGALADYVTSTLRHPRPEDAEDVLVGANCTPTTNNFGEYFDAR